MPAHDETPDLAGVIGHRPLPAGTLLYPCLICGAALPDQGRTFHAQWHTSIAGVAIETTRRVQQLEVS